MEIAERSKASESHPAGRFISGRCKWRFVLAFLRDARWLTRSRIIGYSTALIAGTVAVMTWVLSGHVTAVPAGRPLGTDFPGLWPAPHALLHGQEREVYQLAALSPLEAAVT